MLGALEPQGFSGMACGTGVALGSAGGSEDAFATLAYATRSCGRRPSVASYRSSHPPVKPARLKPDTTYGERRMMSQMSPVR